MNIEQLQYICMVAKTNSITIAAENLYVTQQTISKAINKLENELGVVLMIRSHKGVQLTEVGKTFVEKANQIVQAFQELYDSTYVSTGSNLTGQVRIYQTSYVSHLLSSRFLTNMRRQYPKAHIIIEEKLTAEILEEVRNKPDSIAVIQAVNRNTGLGRIEEYETWLDCEEIFRDTIVACVASNNVLAKKESVSLKELAKYPVVWSSCPHMKEILRQDYHIDVTVLIDSAHQEIQRDTILGGAAVGFATEIIVNNDGYETNGFKILPIKENMRVNTFFIKPKGYQLNKLQKAAIEELKSTLQKI